MFGQKSFQVYQRDTVDRFKEILSSHPKGVFDENGLPAYTNPNPVMRWIFWQRVKVVMEFLYQRAPFNLCIDFGCGLGVMLPFLSPISKGIVAHDLDTSVVEKIGKDLNLNNVSYSQSLENLRSYKGKVDAIIAMDVLEHVDDLETCLLTFQELLTSDGFVLVTGPTENFWYKFGRTLAKYTGHYHVRNIYDINNAMRRKFLVQIEKTLYPIVPLFVVSSATMKKNPPSGLSK